MPQRFWIPKPLDSLTTPAILSEQINNLLALVNQHDPNAVAEVTSWRRDPFNPFLLADQRPVAYMKRAVMSYLDNLIAWGDNLFSSDSREALNEATLLYVHRGRDPRAAAAGGPTAQHTDASYDDLEPQLDAFANAMVDIENYVPAGGGGGAATAARRCPGHRPSTSRSRRTSTLLGYWTTVADRLFKLRHCQNIAGVTRELALFDAPIDPGLLVRPRRRASTSAACSATCGPRPGYRFAALYAQALDFCNAVTGYGAELLAALQKKDAAALAQLLAGQQQQIETDNGQILQAQIDAAAQDLAALQQALALAQAQQEFAADRPWANTSRPSLSRSRAHSAATSRHRSDLAARRRAGRHPGLRPRRGRFRRLTRGGRKDGGTKPPAHPPRRPTSARRSRPRSTRAATRRRWPATSRSGGAERREGQGGQIQVQQVQAQIAASQIRHDLAVQQLANHQNQLDRLQHQIDFLTDMFTSEDLYDWMIGRLSDTYFQSYRLAYKLCQQAERCYRYELGLTGSSFIQFGYWDSLKKGLQAGESLVLDLRRMQASYLEQNARRFEISRYVSLAALDPQALLTLIEHGACDFDLPESLFDGDYPGHYQRRLQRVSVTVVYPNPGRFDNVKCTLTMKHNSVRITTDLGAAYRRQGAADTRFVDEFGAVPQKIVLGNAQDDPGLFLTAINDNLGDPRYLPFEGAGAISSWHLELPAATNEIDLSTVADVVLHLHYTALDGGDTFAQAVRPTTPPTRRRPGAIVLSASNDFPAAWQAFLAPRRRAPIRCSP